MNQTEKIAKEMQEMPLEKLCRLAAAVVESNEHTSSQKEFVLLILETRLQTLRLAKKLGIK